MRAYLVFVCLALLAALTLLCTTESNSAESKQGDAVTVTGAAEAAEAGVRASSRIGFIERRRLGLTVRNIKRILHEMKQEDALSAYVTVSGDGQKEVDTASLAVEVTGRLAAEKPAQWQADLDWDKIIAFVEQILELLIKYLPVIIDLFTVSEVGVCPIAYSPPAAAVLTLAA